MRTLSNIRQPFLFSLKTQALGLVLALPGYGRRAAISTVSRRQWDQRGWELTLIQLNTASSFESFFRLPLTWKYGSMTNPWVARKKSGCLSAGLEYKDLVSDSTIGDPTH